MVLKIRLKVQYCFICPVSIKKKINKAHVADTATLSEHFQELYQMPIIDYDTHPYTERVSKQSNRKHEGARSN